MGTRMLQRRGTAAEWTATNPILGAGEIGYSKNSGLFKIGDGTTAWADLDVTFVAKEILDDTYIATATIDALGDILVGTGPNALARLPKGTAGSRLTVASDGSLFWEAPTSIDLSGRLPYSLFDSAGDMIVGAGADVVTVIPKGAVGTAFMVKAGGVVGWQVPPSAPDLTNYARKDAPAGQQTFAAPVSATQLLEGATRVYSPNNPPPPAMKILGAGKGSGVVGAGTEFLVTAANVTGAMYDSTTQVTVVAPASGIVVAKLSKPPGSVDGRLGVRLSSETASTEVFNERSTGNVTTGGNQHDAPFIGLTPGASYTFVLMFEQYGGGGFPNGTITSTFGSLILEG